MEKTAHGYGLVDAGKSVARLIRGNFPSVVPEDRTLRNFAC